MENRLFNIEIIFIIGFFLCIPGFISGNPMPIEVESSFLMSENLRLSAMGDIDIVIEDFDNKITGYDFGEIGAGLIDEVYSKPIVYIPGIIAFDMTDEDFGQNEHFAERMLGSGTTKIGNNNAISGSLDLSRDRLKYYNAIYGYTTLSSKTINDTLTFCHTFRNINTAMRAGYEFYNSETKYFYGPRIYYANTIYGEPSSLIKLNNNHITIGLAYKFERIKHHLESYRAPEFYSFHTIKCPLIYSGQGLNLGFKSDYQIFYNPDDSTTNHGGLFKVQARHKIQNHDKYFSLGFLSQYENRNVYYQFGLIDKVKRLEIDFGISYLNLLGIQYQHKINYYTYGYTGTEHFNRISQGCEVLFANKQIAMRVGYSFGFAAPKNSIYFNELESVITAGFGFCPVNAKMKIDFAARLKFYRYLEWWYTETGFGLSFYLIGG